MNLPVDLVFASFRDVVLRHLVHSKIQKEKEKCFTWENQMFQLDE